MLETYNTSHKQTTNQILLISDQGIIINAESILFNNCIGKHINSLHPFFSSIIKLLSKKNKTFNFECINLEINNTTYTIDATLHCNGGKPAVFIFQDLTKQYILHQLTAQKKNETEIKSQILNYNNIQLQEKEAFRNNFIANFSHEIRMPVNTINGFVRLLENTNLEQSQRYNLNVVKNTNDKLKTMINDILDISKIETGHFSILPIRFNLIEELNTIIQIYSQKCEEKGITLKHAIDPECPKFIIADKYRLAQIINNLIGNAIKFTPAGSIELKAECITKKDDSVTILFSVKDTGIGIAAKQIDSIFKGFYQINNNITNDGTGLGLEITKKLVLALNGEITVESKLGEGSTFLVTLNFKIAKNQKENKKIKKISEETSKNDFKILLAEPYKKDQVKILKIIDKLKNCDVVVVDNGDKVIEELYKSKFNLVILNIKLPSMDGIDTAKHIRHSELELFNKIPITIISNKPSKEEERYCKEHKINSYIGKPFDKKEVIRKIKYIQQKKQAK